MPHDKKLTTGGSKRSNKILNNKNKYHMRLIIIILVLLIILFIIEILPQMFGTISSPGFPGGCTANPEYKCLEWIYSITSGNVLVNIGQNTGTNWTTAEIYLISNGMQTDSNGVPELLYATGTSNGNVIIDGLDSGATAQLTLPVTTPGVYPNASNFGTIWAVYTTKSGGQTYYANMGTFTFKSV